MLVNVFVSYRYDKCQKWVNENIWKNQKKCSTLQICIDHKSFGNNGILQLKLL